MVVDVYFSAKIFLLLPIREKYRKSSIVFSGKTKIKELMLKKFPGLKYFSNFPCKYREL